MASRYRNDSTVFHAGELVESLAKAEDVHPDTIYTLAKLLKNCT